jgi:L-methionine (R)-S-oxide reductase
MNGHDCAGRLDPDETGGRQRMRLDTAIIEQVLSDIHLYADHETDLTAVLANISAVLKAHRPHYAWVGFYLIGRNPQEMILGPYQGPPTCTTRIPLSAGMCGLAARERKTIILPDVHTDPRYIACNPTVRSEMVVPLLEPERVLGVLDVDSDTIDAFGAEDQALLESAARYVVEKYRRGDAKSSPHQGRGDG